jgi:hypothetical protein
MGHYKLGNAVLIAAVILAKPAVAQSPATNQTAMTFAVENKAIRLSATVNGIPVRFLVDTGATMVAVPTGGRWQTWHEFKVVVASRNSVNRRRNRVFYYVFRLNGLRSVPVF